MTLPVLQMIGVRGSASSLYDESSPSLSYVFDQVRVETLPSDGSERLDFIPRCTSPVAGVVMTCCNCEGFTQVDTPHFPEGSDVSHLESDGCLIMSHLGSLFATGVIDSFNAARAEELPDSWFST